MCRSKPCKFVKNYFFCIKLLHAHLQYVCNIPAKYQMNILKALGGVYFTKYALLPISQYVHWKKIGYVQNAVNLPKMFCFGIKLLHAHLQYVCNIPAKYQMNILKALGGVGFTKYTLLPISQYVQLSKIGYVKNAENLSKLFFFSANKFFMHIYNMSVKYLQSIL